MRKMIVAASMFLAAPAVAGDHDEYYGPPRRIVGFSKMCNVLTGHCQWEPRFGLAGTPIYTHPHRPPVGYYPPPVRYHHVAQPPLARVDALNEGPRCLDRLMSSVGPEAYNVDKAKEAADSMLMEAIRAKHGSRMMDLRHAEARVYECWRSATGNRQSEKVADLGGSELHQCSVTARPCRARQDIADTDDPRTNAMIRTLQEKGYDIRTTEPEDPDAKKKPRLIRRLLKRE